MLVCSKQTEKRMFASHQAKNPQARRTIGPQCEQHVFMNTTDDSQVRCPVCGGPARDVQLYAVTIRACESTACAGYHPAAEQGHLTGGSGSVLRTNSALTTFGGGLHGQLTTPDPY